VGDKLVIGCLSHGSPRPTIRATKRSLPRRGDRARNSGLGGTSNLRETRPSNWVETMPRSSGIGIGGLQCECLAGLLWRVLVEPRCRRAAESDGEGRTKTPLASALGIRACDAAASRSRHPSRPISRMVCSPSLWAFSGRARRSMWSVRAQMATSCARRSASRSSASSHRSSGDSKAAREGMCVSMVLGYQAIARPASIGSSIVVEKTTGSTWRVHSARRASSRWV